MQARVSGALHGSCIDTILENAVCSLTFLMPAGNASLATEWFHKLGYSIQMGVSSSRGYLRAHIACPVVWQSLTGSTSAVFWC